MPTWAWFLIGVAVVAVVGIGWAICVAAGRADERMGIK